MIFQSWILTFYPNRYPNYLAYSSLEPFLGDLDSFLGDFSALRSFGIPFPFSLSIGSFSFTSADFLLRRASLDFLLESEEELLEEDSDFLCLLFGRFLSRESSELFEREREEDLCFFLRLLQSLALMNLPMAFLVAIEALIIRLGAFPLLYRSSFPGFFNNDPLSVKLVALHFGNSLFRVLIVLVLLNQLEIYSITYIPEMDRKKY